MCQDEDSAPIPTVIIRYQYLLGITIQHKTMKNRKCCRSWYYEGVYCAYWPVQVQTNLCHHKLTDFFDQEDHYFQDGTEDDATYNCLHEHTVGLKSLSWHENIDNEHSDEEIAIATEEGLDEEQDVESQQLVSRSRLIFHMLAAAVLIVGVVIILFFTRANGGSSNTDGTFSSSLDPTPTSTPLLSLSNRFEVFCFRWSRATRRYSSLGLKGHHYPIASRF